MWVSCLLYSADDIMWLWWHHRGGSVQSHGFSFLDDFPFFVALLAILQRFDEQDWGWHRAFIPCTDKYGYDALQVELTGMGWPDSSAHVTIHTNAIRLPVRLFGRGTSVFAATSSSSDPLSPGETPEGVEMVAKIYYADQARSSERDLLRYAYGIVAQDGEDGKRVRGHVPVLVAWGGWPDAHANCMEKILGVTLSEQRKRKLSRTLRVLLFLRLRHIFDLTGVEFMKAFLDCFRCEHSITCFTSNPCAYPL